MTRNNIARYMNSVNKNSVHKDLKRESILNNKEDISERMLEVSLANTQDLSDKETRNDNDF